MNHSFRLLALHIDRDCEPKLLKNLKKDYTYYFISGYKYSSDNGGLELVDTAQKLPEGFFSPGSDIGKPILNFSVIVGKNGDGKSSLIDMVIRVMNNFAYYGGYREFHSPLSPIKGLLCTLFFEHDGEIFGIESRNDHVVLIKGNRLNAIPLNKKTVPQAIVPYLFYSIIENYSIYSFRDKDYIGETDLKVPNWLHSILEKNDRYQVPLVICPYRFDGSIDVAIETTLSHQRMMDFFTNVYHGTLPHADAKPFGVAYRMSHREKLLDFLFNCDSKGTKAVELVEKEEYVDRLALLLASYRDFFISCADFSRRDKQIRIYPLSRYIKDKLEQSPALSVEDKMLLNSVTYTQLRRMLMAIRIYELWRESSLIRSMEHLHLHSAQFESAPSEKYRCLLYIIYKTMSLFEKFPKRFENCVQHWIDGSEQELAVAFETLKKEISDHRSLLSVKLEQALNYINYSDILPYETYKNAIGEYEYFIPFEQLRQHVNECYIKCGGNRKRALYKGKSVPRQKISFLLPPIYETEIYMQPDTGDAFLVSQMSSGQRQLLNLVCSVSYHLKNIDNIPRLNGWVNYSNANVVLDEIDLYFHPEYQRKIVKFLIDIFGKIKYEKIKAINFLISTHSPFVLSDVPKQNVLFLKKGAQDFSMQENTFGANIHTLLKNGFFLDGMPIGDFAKEKINDLFAQLNGSNEIASDKLDEIEREALLVSEPLLRKQLLSLIANRRPLCIDKELEILKKRVAELEGRLND